MSQGSNSTADDWRMQLMRVTAFPAPGADPATIANLPQAWWPLVFGSPPDELRHDRKNGVTQLLGVVGDAHMRATANPVSFDLQRLAGHPRQPPPEADTLLPFKTVVEDFKGQALQWLTMADRPPLRRLAFGARLLIPVASVEAANTQLNALLPSLSIQPRSLDFMYQINRRRPSTAVAGLPLNRLSKWGIETVQDVVVAADGTVAVTAGPSACRLDLDINSVPTAVPLPNDSLPDLFSELIQLGLEVASRGDIE